MSETKKPKISLKKLAEFNTVWHEESALVFKSNKELVVIGKLVNKEIVTLTEDDISTCEKFRFKYEIITKEEEEEEEEEPGGGEEEDGGSNVAEGTEEEPEPEASAEEEEEEEAAADTTEEVKVEESQPVPVVPKSIITKPTEQPVVAVTKSSDFMTTVYNLQSIWETTTQENSTKIHSLEIELDKTKKEFMDLQDLYDKMKIKFDGIKQLFS